MGVFDSAKELLQENKETVDGVVDQGVDAAKGVVKDKTPDQLDGMVDQGGEIAKEQIKDQLD